MQVKKYHARVCAPRVLTNAITQAVVLDGRIAFVGGHCIVDSWMGVARTGAPSEISLEAQGLLFTLFNHIQ